MTHKFHVFEKNKNILLDTPIPCIWRKTKNTLLDTQISQKNKNKPKNRHPKLFTLGAFSSEGPSDGAWPIERIDLEIGRWMDEWMDDR